MCEQSATDLASYVNSDIDLRREFGALQSPSYHGEVISGLLQQDSDRVVTRETFLDEPLLLTGNWIPLDFNRHFENGMNGSTRNRPFGRESVVSIRIDLDALMLFRNKHEISSSWSMKFGDDLR